MKKTLLIFYFIFLIFSFRGYSFGRKAEEFDWNGSKVYFLEDNRYPTFQITVYFENGALKDPLNLGGLTSIAFQGIKFGTTRYSAKELNDALEYYGINLNTSVIHEQAFLSYNGLVKDLAPATKMVCHLLRKSSYPPTEIKKYIRRYQDSLRGIITSHSSLANRVFRRKNLEGSLFANPAGGTIRSLGRIAQIPSRQIKSHLHYFLDKVPKKIYISGPRASLKMKSIFEQDCEFKKGESQHSFKESGEKNNNQKVIGKRRNGRLYFLPMPSANQTQIILGRFLEDKETLRSYERNQFITYLLGNGFLSILNRELRIKSGLTYSAGALVGEYYHYGRSLISTSTSADNTNLVLEKIKGILENLKSKGPSEDDMKRTKNYLVGSFPFNFETTEAMMGNYIEMSHNNISYNRFTNFPESIRKFTDKEIQEGIKKIFDWNELDILILGPPKIENDLKKIRPVVKLDYQHYL